MVELLPRLERVAAAEDQIFLYLKKSEGGYFWPQGLHRSAARQIKGGDVVWRQVALPAMALSDAVDVLFIPFHSVPVVWVRKLVVTIHDLAFVKVGHCFPPDVRSYLTWTTRFAARRADHIVTDSEATRQDLIEVYGLPPERITVVYFAGQAIFTDQPSASECAVLHRLGIRQPYFLFLAGSDPRKNFPSALAAFADLVEIYSSKIDLVVTGKGMNLATLPVTDRVRGRIRLPGYVSSQELAALYRSASALVYPSLYEGFGLPLLEAMSCGCPVVASNVSSIPEILGDAGYLVDGNSPKEIAQAMVKCLDDSNRAILRTRGLTRSKLFSWEEAASKLYQVLKSV